MLSFKQKKEMKDILSELKTVRKKHPEFFFCRQYLRDWDPDVIIEILKKGYDCVVYKYKKIIFIDFLYNGNGKYYIEESEDNYPFDNDYLKLYGDINLWLIYTFSFF